MDKDPNALFYTPVFLDATHLILLINNSEIEGFGPIITIHDCFGTHPNKME